MIGVIYSSNDIPSIALLSLGTVFYLYTYKEFFENKYLKKRFLRGKDNNSKIYHGILFSCRLLSSLMAIATMANVLPRWTEYNPYSLGMIFFLVIQSVIVVIALDLMEISMVFRRLREPLPTLLFLVTFMGIIVMSFFAFLAGLLSLLSVSLIEISSGLFISMMFSTLLGVILAIAQWLSKHIQNEKT